MYIGGAALVRASRREVPATPSEGSVLQRQGTVLWTPSAHQHLGCTFLCLWKNELRGGHVYLAHGFRGSTAPGLCYFWSTQWHSTMVCQSKPAHLTTARKGSQDGREKGRPPSRTPTLQPTLPKRMYLLTAQEAMNS